MYTVHHVLSGQPFDVFRIRYKSPLVGNYFSNTLGKKLMFSFWEINFRAHVKESALPRSFFCAYGFNQMICAISLAVLRICFDGLFYIHAQRIAGHGIL